MTNTLKAAQQELADFFVSTGVKESFAELMSEVAAQIVSDNPDAVEAMINSTVDSQKFFAHELINTTLETSLGALLK